MRLNFRKLFADEIDVRVQSYISSSKGAILLLYKDARCDMNILDETVGVMNWQRSHTRDNANCIVSIYDNDKGLWVSKEDTGTESFTEKEKGLASDSFKRACFNWGIGRELYTAPFIWVNIGDDETFQGKIKSSVKFKVKEINYDNMGKIDTLIVVDNNGKERFNNKKEVKNPKQETKKEVEEVKYIKKEQSKWLKDNLDPERFKNMLKFYKLIRIEDMELATATAIIGKMKQDDK